MGKASVTPLTPAQLTAIGPSFMDFENKDQDIGRLAQNVRFLTRLVRLVCSTIEDEDDGVSTRAGDPELLNYLTDAAMLYATQLDNALKAKAVA